MNGDDYDGKKGTAKLSVKDVFLQDTVRHLVITSGDIGAWIYMDGKLAAAKKGLRSAMPAAGKDRVMVLGNSVYGRHAWTGEVFGLALYSWDLLPEDVQERYRQWREREQIAVDPTIAPDVLYSFTDREGFEAADEPVRPQIWSFRGS